MKRNYRPYHNLFIFLLGASCWVALFSPFISCAALYADAKQYSGYINYFLNAVLSGVYPSWDPFNLFGRPDGLFGRISGDSNAFLFFIVILQKAGIPYPKAYVLFYAGYFLFGMAGFFALARIFLKDRLAAAVSFFILLFSNFCFCLLNDAQIIMIFVPGVWSFYFLRMFWRRPRVRSLLAAILFIDVLLTAYLPFFIITIFITILIFSCLFYPHSIRPGFKRVLVFFRHRPRILGLALFLLLLGLAPAFIIWLIIQKGELMLNWRSSSAVGKSLVQISLAEINNGGFVPYDFSPHYWFSCLKTCRFVHFYVPVMAFCLMLSGAFCLITRRLLLFVSVFTVLFLISIGNASGLEPFLYVHIAYFKLFRNLHFLLWLSFPFAVLACGELFRLSLLWIRSGFKWVKALYILMAHLGFIYLLYSTQVYVVWPVYAGVIICGVAFFTYIFFPLRKGLFLFLLLGVMLVQSTAIFNYYARQEDSYIHHYRPPAWANGYQPVFSYQRPARGTPWDSAEEGYGSMQDASGFDYPRFTGSRWAGELLNGYPAEELEGYVINKFVLYQRGFALNDPADRPKALERILAGQCGGALIEGGAQGLGQGMENACTGPSVVLNKDSQGFKVLSFGLNHIRFETDWPVAKYFVYNDTFSVLWHAQINGHAARIDRVNVAFKGIALPAGKNIVEMRYGSSFMNLVRVGLTWGYLVFAVIVGLILLRPSWFRRRGL